MHHILQKAALCGAAYGSAAYPCPMAKTWITTCGDTITEGEVTKILDDVKLRELLTNLEPPTDDDTPFKFADHPPVPLTK